MNIASRGLTGCCLLVSILFILMFLAVALASLRYPFGLEWMEGQMINVILRISEGKPVYAAPTLEYVPFIYTPLYYYVCALVSSFTGGVDFFPARLVSLLSAVGCGILLHAWVRKEGGSITAGLIGAGVFSSTYILSARWFDLGRIDSLFLFLTLLGLFLVFHYRSMASAVMAGVVFAAAFFTKQLALAAALPVLLVWFIIERRRALAASATMGFLLVAGVAFLEWQSDGWFIFYTYTVPAGHALRSYEYVNFWLFDILKNVGFLFAAALLAMFCLYRGQDKKKTLAYAVLLAGLVGASYVARIHTYGYHNVLIPAHAALALMAGLAFGWVAQLGRAWATPTLASLLIIQMAMLAYDPTKYIPTQDAVDTGNHFLEEISTIHGDIFMPTIQFVQGRVGKKSFDYGMAAFDLLRADLGEQNHIKRKFRKELRQALKERRFAAIMLAPPRIVFSPDKDPMSYTFDRHIPFPRYMTNMNLYNRVTVYVPDLAK